MVAAAALLSWFFVGVQLAISRHLRLGKIVRQDGPESHLGKSGTPSMGGVAFTLAAVAIYFLAGSDVMKPVLLLAIGFGLLGLADDLAGLAAQPLRAREKLVIQFAMAIIFADHAIGLVHYTGWSWLDFVLVVLAIVGYANAFNFTDGLDGLAASVTVIILLPLLSLSLAQIFLGALLGFLWYNAPKALIFMGDAGSQLLGALVAGLMIMSGKGWWLPLVAIIPTLEIVSVIAQVIWFRRTGGRRLLKMAPLHHHFELIGWDEAQVVFRFAIITAVAVSLAFQLWGGVA